MSRAVVNICEELPETSPKPDALLMRIVEDLLGYATGHLCLLDLLTNSSSVVVKKVHGCLTDEVLTLRSAISVVGVLKDTKMFLYLKSISEVSFQCTQPAKSF